MKKYFIKTNGYNCVMVKDENGAGHIFHEDIFNDDLTLDVAKNSDFSNVETGTVEEWGYNNFNLTAAEVIEILNDAEFEIVEF